MIWADIWAVKSGQAVPILSQHGRYEGMKVLMKMQNTLLHQPNTLKLKEKPREWARIPFNGVKSGKLHGGIGCSVERNSCNGEVNAPAANRSRSWMETCLHEIFDESVASRIIRLKRFQWTCHIQTVFKCSKGLKGDKGVEVCSRKCFTDSEDEGSTSLRCDRRVQTVGGFASFKRPHFQSN